jgi:hypothetical protein
MSPARGLLAGAALLAMACGRVISLGGDADAGASPDAGSTPVATTIPVCPGTCITTEGPLFAFTSMQELHDALQGRWLFCATPGVVDSVYGSGDVVGIEFVDAVAYDLVPGPNGTPVRGASFSHEYQVEYEFDFDTSGQLSKSYVTLQSAGSMQPLIGGSVGYSACPEKLLLGDRTYARATG